MSLDRVQIVRNFTSQTVVLQALGGTATTPYDAASAGIKAVLDTKQRVGRIEIVLAAAAAVTVTDVNGVAYTITAAAVPMVHVIPVINAHKIVRLSGSGTVPVLIYAD